MIKNIKKKKGFTLIELIIVIAIIGILAAIAVPKFGGIQKDAKVKADIASAKVIANATEALIAQNTIIPVTAGTTIILGDTSTQAAAIAGYLQSLPTPKSTSTANFTVVIEADGDVIVQDGTIVRYPN